jgi:16S rRNA (uracil1498-N3)-methyltransferase
MRPTMADPRIYIEQPLKVGDVIDLPEGAARHLLQVLRLKAGDSFLIFNGEPGEFAATLEAAGKRGARARIGPFHEANRESPLHVTLAQCVSKGERMDFALQKAVELGATEIQPLLSKRSVVRVDEERWEKKLEHWRGVVIAACEQSGRTRVPPVNPVLTLERWLEQTDPGLRLVLVPGAGEALRALDKPERPVRILIGPEGGLDDDELRLAVRHGCEPISLGPRVLRTETAGIAALAALQALFGDCH